MEVLTAVSCEPLLVDCSQAGDLSEPWEEVLQKRVAETPPSSPTLDFGCRSW